MIPFTPQFLTWINSEKRYDNEINVANLMKKFECMMIEYMQKTKKEKVFYFKIPKEYNCVRKQFLENIVNNLEKEGFTYNKTTEIDITRTYSFYTSYLKYTKVVKENPKLVNEYCYESPLYIEYGTLEDAIGIKVCI